MTDSQMNTKLSSTYLSPARIQFFNLGCKDFVSTFSMGISKNRLMMDSKANYYLTSYSHLVRHNIQQVAWDFNCID